MSLPRFFHSPLPNSGAVALEETEARHASNVLRLTVGDDVVLFDGLGGEAQGKVVASSKRTVSVEITARTDSQRELPCPLELLVALPKGDRQKSLVDGLVQLGVTRLTPLVCQRGVAQPTAVALERLRRSVIESSKQCGRNQLMYISLPQTITETTRPASEQSDTLSLVAHPYGPRSSLREMAGGVGSRSTAARFAVGPEGGFSELEMEQWLNAGWRVADLGPRILRIELAAMQLAAWWATR